MSVTISVEIPNGAMSALRTSPSEFRQELMRAAVCKWYELGRISQSKGSEILGISRAELLDVLSQYKVSPFQVDEDDLKGEREGE